jgi:hypothetical protein
MHQVRRLHLYFGLFLFPWAVLYGVTAFLFNHPSAFPDEPVMPFNASTLAGTPLETLPTPREQAEVVVAALNAKQKPEVPYRLGDGPVEYATRDFVFANVRTGDRTFSILYDVKGHDGRVRETTPHSASAEKAPFATGKVEPRRMMSSTPTHKHSDAVKPDGSVVDRFKAAAPTILERCGCPTGEVTVTSAPDLRFPIVAGDRTWTATYSLLNGSVTGSPADQKRESDLSVRRFLTRMHLAHGFPGEVNAKWVWAVVVDAMAFVMCFWGVSGLFMWWQLKATRRPGSVVLSLSAIAATALGFAMYALLS